MATKEWQEANQEKVRKYRRDWYSLNSQKQIERQSIRRKEHKEWLKSLKLSCTECEESHIATLDFHHIDPATKEFTLSRAIHNGLSKEKILAEIAKCKILCSNCHRKHHYEERQSNSLSH